MQRLTFLFDVNLHVHSVVMLHVNIIQKNINLHCDLIKFFQFVILKIYYSNIGSSTMTIIC